MAKIKKDKKKLPKTVTVIQTERTENGVRIGNSVEVTETGHKETEPHYIKLYLKNILVLNDLPTGKHKVLNELLRRVEYQTNRIILNMYVKKEIADNCGLKVNTVNNSIQVLTKKGILTRIATGVYVANPHLFGRGRWADIQLLRLTVEFSEEGVHDAVEIEYSS